MKIQQNITVILFDFVGVLMNVIDMPPDPVADEINTMIGSVTDDAIFKKEVLGKFYLTEKQFEEYLEKIVNRFEPYIPVWKMIVELKKHYKLSIINNGTALTLPRFFARFPELTTQFDVFISSAKEGVKKPNPKIYLRACEKLHVQPENCLFMDNDKRNIDGAAKLGMQTIWWKTYEKGLKEFIKFI